jgi:xylulokinase
MVWQDPREWYQALKLTLKDALAKGKISLPQIVSIAIGAATHTMVLLDEKNEVLRPAILWTDKRTISQVEALRNNFGSEIFSETLHMANVNWTLPYLVWVRENEPEVWKRAQKLLMPKDYIRFKLTGVLATDWMDAHGTLMFNVLKREWSEKICHLAGIPMEILPPVYPPEKIVDGLSQSAAENLGLPEGIPVVIGTTDQASSFGSGLLDLVRDHEFTRNGCGYETLAIPPGLCLLYQARLLVHFSWDHILYRLLPVAERCPCEENCSRKTGAQFASIDGSSVKSPVGCEGLIFIPTFKGYLDHLRADFIIPKASKNTL